MFKTIVYLLFVTQIIFAAEDEIKPVKEDEIDITSVKPNFVEDSSNKPEYPVTQYENSYNSEVTISTKSEDNPIVESDNSGIDEQQVKKADKPFGSGTDVDLGKEYKEVLIKTTNNGKDSEKDVNFGSFDPNNVNTDFSGEDKKPEDKLNGIPFDGSEKEVKPGNSHRKETEIGNEVTDHLIKLLKTDYRSDFENVKLGKFEPFKHGRWGSVALHSGVVTGLSNIERVGDVVVVDEYNNRKLVIADIAVKNIYADYKMNAKLFHRISFKDRDLKLELKKAVLSVKLEVDKSDKKLIVKDLTLKSTEGFSVKSGRLAWPFNKLVNAIAKNQEHVIKDLIRKEFDRHMGKVIHNIEFDSVFAKLF